MFFEGICDDINQPLIQLPSCQEKLNESTEVEAARRFRHKIIFNQHLPFEHLAFH